MTGKRTPLLSSLLFFVSLGALVGLVFLVGRAFFLGPAGGDLSIRSIHYTFRELHGRGEVFYGLIALALASWCFRPSPRTSTRGR
jgi:hypothetical protein